MERNVVLLERWGAGGTNPDTPQRRFLGRGCRSDSKPHLRVLPSAKFCEDFQSWETVMRIGLVSSLLFVFIYLNKFSGHFTVEKISLQ